MMIWFVVMIIIAIYIANDATRMGQNGMLWGALVLFMPMMGLLVYLIVRNTSFTSDLQDPSQNRGINHETDYRVKSYRPPVYQNIKQPKSEIEGNDPYEKSHQYCTNCGHKNKPEAIYCNSCGVRILSIDLM
jgi:hypothetical protein